MPQKLETLTWDNSGDQKRHTKFTHAPKHEVVLNKICLKLYDQNFYNCNFNCYTLLPYCRIFTIFTFCFQLIIIVNIGSLNWIKYKILAESLHVNDDIFPSFIIDILLIASPFTYSF